MAAGDALIIVEASPCHRCPTDCGAVVERPSVSGRMTSDSVCHNDLHASRRSQTRSSTTLGLIVGICRSQVYILVKIKQIAGYITVQVMIEIQAAGLWLHHELPDSM